MFTKEFLVDAAERVGLTFVEAFLGALVLAGVFNLDTLESAALAGVAAGLALVKSIVAGRLKPSPVSPASLVTRGDAGTADYVGLAFLAFLVIVVLVVLGVV